MSTATFQLTVTAAYDLDKRPLAEIAQAYIEAEAYILSTTMTGRLADAVTCFNVEAVQIYPERQPLNLRLAATEAFIRGLREHLNEHGDAGAGMHMIDVFFGADPYAA